MVSTSTGIYACIAPATATSCVVTGLTNGLAYTFSVRAANAIGVGIASGTATATPKGVPGEPLGVAAVMASGTSIALTWGAP